MGKILLMRQREDAIGSLRQLLIDEGHDVVEALTLQEAQNLMSLQPCGLAFVLCDPIATGYAYARHFKHHQPRMTIILMVRRSNLKLPHDAIEAGADGLVPRPFRADKIRRAVVEGLKMHELKARYEEASVARG